MRKMVFFSNVMPVAGTLQLVSFRNGQRVAFDKTHCKPFDLPIPEQWVFGYTL